MKTKTNFYTRNLRKWLKRVTEQDIQDGKQWYVTANQLAHDIGKETGHSFDQIAQVISILSPQTKWEDNIKNARAVASGKDTKGIFATCRQLEECEKVLAGKFSIPEKRSKTWKFAHCIATGGLDHGHVVIDRHAISVCLDNLESNNLSITAKRYREAERAYQIVAKENQLTGPELQAILWVTYKRIVNR